MATGEKQTSGLAIAGLVLGIIAATTSFLPIINNLSAFIAVIGGILATIALVGAVRGRHTAKGLSIAGVVLAIASFAIVLVTQAAYSSALKSAAESIGADSKPVATSANDESAPAAATDEATPEQPADEPPAQQPAGEETAAPQQDFSSLAVGEAVTYQSGLSVVVNSVQRGLAKYDGSPVTGISVTYVNNGTKDASFGSYDWKGEDANGVQRSITFISDGENELSSGSLAPGGTVTGNLYFEGDIVRAIFTENMFIDDSRAAWVLG